MQLWAVYSLLFGPYLALLQAASYILLCVVATKTTTTFGIVLLIIKTTAEQPGILSQVILVMLAGLSITASSISCDSLRYRKPVTRSVLSSSWSASTLLC
jgi:hypothetical protein